MYKIISDGSCDLGTERAAQLQIDIVPFYVSTDQETYLKEIEELGVHDLYQFMIDHPGVYPKTSLPTVNDYIEMFTGYVEKEIPILCICITSKFSGSYNSAMNAKQMIEEDYPNAKITVIDSTINTVLQGTYLQELASYRDAGASYEELIDKANEIKSTGRIFFTVDSFDYLTQGGRLGKLGEIASNTLKIKPLIVLKNGEIFPFGIARTRENAKKRVIDQAIKYVQQNGNDPEQYRINIGYGYDKAEGEQYYEKFLTKFQSTWPDAKLTIGTMQIGATIGVHTGPYPLGCGIVKKAK